MTSKAPDLADRIVSERSLRRGLATGSHSWFFSTYLGEYVRHPTAPFQREFFRVTEDDSIGLAVLTAFRGSAKSTIFTTSYPIWAILGRQRKRFVVIASQTQSQSRLHLSNLKRELESNRVLRADLGPFEERNEEWSSGSLVLPDYGARITALSIEQGIRGLRHGSRRPDLIICDDMEDIGSVRTRESRNRTHQWFLGDLVPAGDVGTKTIVIGNLLHEDSLIMRLRDQMERGELDGIFRAFPILADDGTPAWPGKFGSAEEVGKFRRRIGDEIAWQREYMLRIVSDTDRVVHPEWISTYDELPKPGPEVRPHCIYSGVDLAISERTSADCTAIVTVAVYDVGKETRVFVLPHPVNQRLSFPDATARIRQVFETAHGGNRNNRIFVEDVGYQRAMVQQLKAEGLPAEGVGTGGADKRSRIALTSPYIESGRVLFPETGCEELISQLVGFGTERFDDLADAFSLVVGRAAAVRRASFGLMEVNRNASPTLFGDIMNMRF
ncbi:MAG: hypothetical protein ABIJ46_01780 [bacterium]